MICAVIATLVGDALAFGRWRHTGRGGIWGSEERLAGRFWESGQVQGEEIGSDSVKWKSYIKHTGKY